VAAPHVAGAAALVKSLLPSASVEQVRGFLVNNARPFPAGSACATGGPFAGLCGAGLLDAGAAVSRAVLSAPPVIVSAPQSLSIVEGQTATLAVTAAGAAPLRYQWKRNGVDVAGATASSYTTPALSVGDSGTRYAVAVANPLGSITSAEATITVTPASSGGPASPPVGGGGGGALPPGQLLLLVALLAAARLRRRE
jgi:serine protease